MAQEHQYPQWPDQQPGPRPAGVRNQRRLRPHQGQAGVADLHDGFAVRSTRVTASPRHPIRGSRLGMRDSRRWPPLSAVINAVITPSPVTAFAVPPSPAVTLAVIENAAYLCRLQVKVT